MKMDDGADALVPLSPVCTFCKHLRSVVDHTCDAFPKKNGIPVVIWQGDNPHLSPFEGDHGIQFEPIENEMNAIDLELWERKALHDFRAKGRVWRTFESEAIDPDEHARISAALKAAQDIPSIKAAFKGVDGLLDSVDADARVWAEEATGE